MSVDTVALRRDMMQYRNAGLMVGCEELRTLCDSHDAITAIRAVLVRLDRGLLTHDEIEAIDLVRESLPKESTEAPERY